MQKHKLVSFDQSQQILQFGLAKRENSWLFQFELNSKKDKSVYDWGELFKNTEVRELGSSERKDDLWKDTCLEFFLAADQNDSTEYYEFNLGKNLNWNLYHLDSYRQGLKSCEQVQHIQVHNQENLLSIEWSEFLIGTPLFLSATAVLKTKEHKTEYHALRHASEKPDFHLRKSFVISI